VKLEHLLKRRRMNPFFEKDNLAKTNDMKKLKEFIRVSFKLSILSDRRDGSVDVMAVHWKGRFWSIIFV